MLLHCSYHSITKIKGMALHSFVTCAGLLCSMSGSDYPPRCLTSLSVWVVSSLWCSSAGSWPPALTTGLATASSLTSGPPLRSFGWAWPWPFLCLGCGEQEIVFLSCLFWIGTRFSQLLPIEFVHSSVSEPLIDFKDVIWKATLANYQTNTRRRPSYPCAPLLVQLELGCYWIHRVWPWPWYPLLMLHSLGKKSLDPDWWNLIIRKLHSTFISFYDQTKVCLFFMTKYLTNWPFITTYLCHDVLAEWELEV